jgi:hypothetical protein
MACGCAVFGTAREVSRAAAMHAERRMSKALSDEYRPRYAPWFIAVIGVGMVLIGGYFVVGALVGMSS